MRGLALGLSLSVAFIIGCLAGPHLTPSADAQARETYRYACIDGHQDELQLGRLLDAQGLVGRELVAVGSVGSGHGSQWCFRVH